MFVDRCKIELYAGNGGDGVVSFRREKYIPRGGPDGGNGGDGGSIIAAVDPELSTLLDFRFHVVHRATHGQPGRGKSQHGRSGDDITLRFPPGTVVSDADSGEHIADLLEPGDAAMLAQGGAGGLGNEHFKHALNQTPRESTPGEPGQERRVLCELKLIADVGLVGMPNAGKSTLLRAVSRATPKVADYPFTTLTPQLGIAELDIERRLVVADIPGLIGGAADGAGLGHRFLRHVERTRVLIHVIDFEPTDGSSPAANYSAIRRELGRYAPALANKPELVAINKADLLGGMDSGREAVAMFRAQLDERPPSDAPAAPAVAREPTIMPISAATGEGVPQLLDAAWRLVEREHRGASPTFANARPTTRAE